MKCFTIVNLDVYDGIKLEPGVRPYIEVGPGCRIPLSDDMIGRVGEDVGRQVNCQGTIGGALLHGVFVKEASLEVTGDGRMQLIPQVCDDSLRRALVLADLETAEFGVTSRSSVDNLGRQPSLKITRRVRRTLHHDCDDETKLQPVARKRLAVVMDPGNSFTVAIQWFYRDPRGLMRRAEQPDRHVLSVGWDGTDLSVRDLRLFASPAWQVAETL